jgi:hypothetical protein
MHLTIDQMTRRRDSPFLICREQPGHASVACLMLPGLTQTRK